MQTKRRSNADRQVRMLAASIANQAQLDAILATAKPGMRDAVLDRIRPFLTFAYEEPIQDCPVCGLRRGAMIQHHCTPKEAA